MEALDPNSHTFIVKVWLEESAAEAGAATWRGHITHIPTKERRYLQELLDIPAFIAPYLQELGIIIEPRRAHRLWHRLRRRVAMWKRQNGER